MIQSKPEKPAPPVEHAIEHEDEWEPPRTAWPKIIGVGSLLYALMGMTCMLGMAVWPLATGAMTGGKIEFPTILKATTWFASGAGIVLGIIMLTGAIQLLRRRRSGVAWLKRWVILRILFGIINLGIFVATAQHQVDMQRMGVEFQNQMMIDNGRPDAVKEFDDEAMTKRTFIQGVAFFGVSLIYPFGLGFFLARHKIDDEIRAWE